MKLQDFLSNNVTTNTQITTYQSGFLEFLKSSEKTSTKYKPLGMEQLYFDWLRTAYSYRRMFIQDLYLLAFDITEVRTALLHLKNEIFRKGFDEWIPKFVAKCPKCAIEYQEPTEFCPDCFKTEEKLAGYNVEKVLNSAGEYELNKKPYYEKAYVLDEKGNKVRVETISPDLSQIDYFEKVKYNCNEFGKTIEDNLRMVVDDVNICVVPETLIYRMTPKQGYTQIKNIQVGDKVYTHTGKVKKVLKVYTRQINEEIFKLTLDNREIIKITGNHPIYTKRGWIRVDELTKEDILYKLSDVKNYTNNLTSEERKVRCWKVGALKRKGIKRGKYNYISPRKGLTWEQYYGLEKAKIIKEKNSLSQSGKPHGYNFRKKIGNFKGLNNPNWNGGIARLPYTFEFNNDLKYQIFKRDNFTCQICKKYSINCSAHHIDYDKTNSVEKNLISLCKSCHMKTGYRREFWKEFLTNIISEKYVSVHNGSRIIEIKKECYEGIVYNLEIEDDNSYVGKGIIYHNCDDAFLLLNKTYKYENNRLKYSKVEEIRRIHPALMEIELDKEGLPKNTHWICYEHRGQPRTDPGLCLVDECGKETFPVMYIYNHRGSRLYYTEDEIIHFSRFSESDSYGYSPLLTIMQKILTLSGMDRFLYRYFFERKTPTGIILTYTDDPKSLDIAKDTVESKMMEDPTYTPWVAVSTKTGRGRTDFVRLFHTLHEMDYLPVRNEIRDRVSSIYGVPQMYMNVMEGVGGISGQTQQLRLFSITIEDYQRIINEKVLPKILKAFGITDWEIKLRTPEEKTEQAQLQVSQQKIQLANALFQMGFDIKLQKGKGRNLFDIDFSVSGEAKRLDVGGGLPMQKPGGKDLALPGEKEDKVDEEKKSPDEVEKLLAEFKKPRKNTREEDAFNEVESKSLDSQEDSDKSKQENMVWNEHK